MRFRTFLVIAVAARCAVLALAGFRVSRSGPKLKVSINMLAYGDAYAGSLWESGLSRNDETAKLQVLIENESNRPLDLFMDGCSWGDPTLAFVATTPDGKVHKLPSTPLEYLKNAPGFVRLQPGQTWVRDVFYNSTKWSEFRELISKAQAPLTLQAVLTQDPGSMTKKDPNLWSGSVASKAVSVAVR
jgi:hypothetical protein